jgi:hypothetical protein
VQKGVDSSCFLQGEFALFNVEQPAQGVLIRALDQCVGNILGQLPLYACQLCMQSKGGYCSYRGGKGMVYTRTEGAGGRGLATFPLHANACGDRTPADDSSRDLE